MIALLLLALALAAAALQLSLPWPGHWPLWPLDLPLLVAAFAGLTRGGGWGLACGVLSGLVMDLALGPAIGLRLAPLGLAGALADALQPGVNRDQPRLQMAAVIAMTLLHDLVLAVMGRRMGLPQGGLPLVALRHLFPRLAFQGIACLAFFRVLGLLVRQKVFLDPRARDVQTIRRWG